MSNVFPGSLNNYVTGSSSVTLLAAGHAAEHNAIEQKLGITNSADTNSIDYKLSHLLTANVTDLTASATEINKLAGLTTTKTELGYVSGVTSAIQTQIETLVPYTGATTDLDLGSFNLNISNGNIAFGTGAGVVTVTNSPYAAGSQVFLPSGSGTFALVEDLPFDPAGTIIMFAGAAAPTGYLLCDGATVSKTTYAALFAVTGHTYGADPGNDNFILPNLKGKVVVGFNASETEFDALGETGGEKTHQLIVGEMPAHAHTVPHWYAAGTQNTKIPTQDSMLISVTENTSSVGGDGSHQNLQPYITLQYIIKT